MIQLIGFIFSLHMLDPAKKESQKKYEVLYLSFNQLCNIVLFYCVFYFGLFYYFISIALHNCISVNQFSKFHCIYLLKDGNCISCFPFLFSSLCFISIKFAMISLFEMCSLKVYVIDLFPDDESMHTNCLVTDRI